MTGRINWPTPDEPLGVSEGEPLRVLLPTGQRSTGEWIDDTLRTRAEEQGLLDRLKEEALTRRVVRGDISSDSSSDED